MEVYLLFIVTGLVAGLLAGLLGIGGGVITVPALYYILQLTDVPQEEAMYVSIATALASTIITSSGSTYSQTRKKAILHAALKFLIPGLCLGCISGAILTYFLTSEILRLIFGSLVLLLSIYFFFPTLRLPQVAPSPNSSLALYALGIGSLSTLLGIGGGIFTVPLLLSYGVSVRQSVATSSAATLVTATLGTIAYLLIAHNNHPSPDLFGYIEIPAVIAIGLSSLLTTPLGVKLSHTLPTPLIKRIFACALFATGSAMIIGK
jgi:uncharacterized membrane protein YfcA